MRTRATDSDPRVRQTVFQTLGRKDRSREATDILLAGIRDSDPYAASLALDALSQRVKKPTKQMLTAVRSLLHANNSSCAAHAAAVLEQWSYVPVEADLPGLTLALGAPSSGANAALNLLEKLGEPALPALLRLLHTGTPQLQMSAAFLLATIGPVANDALPAIREMAASDDGLRRAAGTQAQRLLSPGPEALAAIRSCIGFVDAEYSAFHLIKSLGKFSVEFLPDLLRRVTTAHHEEFNRDLAEVFQVMAEYSPRVLEGLCGLLHDPETSVRRNALQVLEAMGSHAGDAVPEIEALAQRDPELAEACQDAIWMIRRTSRR